MIQPPSTLNDSDTLSLLKKITKQTKELLFTYDSISKVGYAFNSDGYIPFSFIENSIVYHNFYNSLHPLDRDITINSVNDIATGKIDSTTLDIRIYNHHNKSYFYHNLYLSAYRNNGENTILGSLSSINLSKQQELQNKHLIDIYKALFQDLPIGVELYDKNGYILDTNNKNLEIYGVDNKEDILKVRLWDNVNLSKEHIKEIKEGKVVSYDQIYDFDLVKKNSSYRTTKTGESFFRIKHSSIMMEGKIAGYLWCTEDIKELHESNKNLNKLFQEYKTILDNIPVGVVLYDSDGKQTFINNACANMFGITDTKAHSNNKISIFNDPASDKDLLKRITQRENIDIVLCYNLSDLEGSKYYHPTFKEENSIYLDCKVRYITDSYNRDNDMILVIISDVTDNKKYETRLQIEKEKAQEANLSKSIYLANMSHEIRTPLNSIVGFSELLASAETEQEKMEFLSIIKNNNALLIRLINDILDLAKIESGHIKLEPKEFDVNNLFSESYKSFKSKFENDKVEFIVRKPYKICIVNLDRSRILQIYNNFLTNAIKHTNSGSITCGYEYVNNGLKIYTKDTGKGIPLDKQPLIFGRFQKLDSYSKGTGLGLAICKAIAEAMGGTIGFESKEGAGSLFWAWIPCKAKITI